MHSAILDQVEDIPSFTLLSSQYAKMTTYLQKERKKYLERYDCQLTNSCLHGVVPSTYEVKHYRMFQKLR